MKQLNNTYASYIHVGLSALKLGVFKNQCMLHFRLYFLPDMPKLEHLNLAR